MCHDVLMMSINLSNIAILNIHGADYLSVVSGISKNKATNLLQRAELKETKRNIIKKIKFFYHM